MRKAFLMTLPAAVLLFQTSAFAYNGQPCIDDNQCESNSAIPEICIAGQCRGGSSFKSELKNILQNAQSSSNKTDIVCGRASSITNF
jgi:hypothetical protein